MRLFRHCGGIGQRHPCVGRNDLRHLTHGQGHRAVVVSCAKIGHHGATDIADLGIVEDTLEPIADVDAIFVIVDGQKYQGSAVSALFAYLPGIFKLVGPISGVIAIEVADGNDGKLGVCLGVVKLGAKAVKLRNGLRRKDMGKVADVIGGLGQVFHLLGPCDGNQENDERRQGQPASEPMYAQSVHCSSLYGLGRPVVPVPDATAARR